ncbi:hypothetical protein PG994_004320 [Apiospora phragmitis]|uniref:Transposase n=1 Tax=Apiospora phragmitis TaxID=2905665 RepID=A0ABR1VQA2_9PEZI
MNWPPGQGTGTPDLASLGWGARAIRTRYPHLALSTIKRTIKMEKLHTENASLPKTGRPRLLTEEERDDIYDVVKHQNPDVTYQELLQRLGGKVQKSTLRAYCREMGLTNRDRD